MLSYVYKRCVHILASKPFLLWGLSLLSALLTALAAVFGVLPIISFPLTLTLQAGVAMIYLDGYKGNPVNSDQLFKGFTNFWHVAGGMAWRALWTFLWSLISVVSILVITMATGALAAISVFHSAMNSNLFTGMDDYGYGNSFGNSVSSGMSSGVSVITGLLCVLLGIAAIFGIVVVIIKTYSYRFTPYILMEHPEISATEALRMSMKQTKGHKGTLFLADFICGVCVFLLYLANILFSMIPYIGIVFAIILSIVLFILYIILPLFMGLVRAGLYIEITTTPAGTFHKAPTPQPKPPVYPNPYHEPTMDSDFADEPSMDSNFSTNPATSDAPGFCTQCGAALKPGQKFCTKCGKPTE